VRRLLHTVDIYKAQLGCRRLTSVGLCGGWIHPVDADHNSANDIVDMRYFQPRRTVSVNMQNQINAQDTFSHIHGGLENTHGREGSGVMRTADGIICILSYFRSHLIICRWSSEASKLTMLEKCNIFGLMGLPKGSTAPCYTCLERFRRADVKL